MLKYARHVLCLCLVLSYGTILIAQDQIRLLPPNINRPSINLYAPFVSGDGQTMIYLSDYTDDGHHSMHWTTKKTVSTWNDGMEVNKLINRPTLNYRGGYSLNFDGNMMFFTSRKSGLGGFDIWYSHKRGNDWQAPANAGMPVNTSEHEGAAMMSPDGQYLYFMRCDRMSEYGGAEGCSIYVAEKNHYGWEEPVALPANINTGNSQTPRILADGETLIFASDMFGGKGGLDLYLTKKAASGWSDPIPLDFVNTEKNDQFVSIPAKGRYLYADIQGSRDQVLAQILIPEALQPEKVMRVSGNVKDAVTGEPLNAELTVFNIPLRDRLWNEKVGSKGAFDIVLKEGSVYDISVNMEDDGYMFFSKIYDLEQAVGARDKEHLDIRLQKMAAGITYPIDIVFEENSAELSDHATFELRRLSALLRKYPEMVIAIKVQQNNYREDSIASDPDLTEVRIDSVFHLVKYPVVKKGSVDSLLMDSLQFSANDLSVADTVQYENDSITYENEIAGATDTVRIQMKDSLMADGVNAAVTDSLSLEQNYKIVEELEIIRIYHNDRTQKQAEAIRTYLAGRGVNQDRIYLQTNRNGNDVSERDIMVTLEILQF